MKAIGQHLSTNPPKKFKKEKHIKMHLTMQKLTSVKEHTHHLFKCNIH